MCRSARPRQMGAAGKHVLRMPTAATSAVLIMFAAYYLLAPGNVVDTSVARYSRLDRPVRHALSIVPSGLVRQRGACPASFQTETFV